MMSSATPTVNYDLATDTGRCVFTIRPGFDDSTGRPRTINRADLPELNRHNQIVTKVYVDKSVGIDGTADVHRLLIGIADAIGVHVSDLHVTYRRGDEEAIDIPNSRHCDTGVDALIKTRFASV